MTLPSPASQVPPGPTPFDTGNPLLGEQPALMNTAVVTTPAGQRLALTVRTPSTTLTVFLAGKDAKAWATALTAASGGMSASGLLAANGNVKP